MSGFVSGHCPGDAAASGGNPGCAGRFPAAALGRCPRSIQADPVRQPLPAGLASAVKTFAALCPQELISIDKQLRFPLVWTLLWLVYVIF